MLEVKPTSQRGCMVTGSGLNIAKHHIALSNCHQRLTYCSLCSTLLMSTRTRYWHKCQLLGDDLQAVIIDRRIQLCWIVVSRYCIGLEIYSLCLMPFHCCAANLSKSFTHKCACPPSSINWYRPSTVTFWSREGNCRPGRMLWQPAAAAFMTNMPYVSIEKWRLAPACVILRTMGVWVAAAWHSGSVVCRMNRVMLSLVSTRMHDHLWAGISPGYVTCHLGQPSLATLQSCKIEHQL